MIEAILNSSVLAAIVTGGFAFAGSIFLYYVSKSKKPKSWLGHRKQPVNNRDSLTYAGYESLLRQNAIELERLYSVAQDREQLITLMRTKENELYAIIRKKDEEISRLRHYRKFHEAALRGEPTPEKPSSGTMEQ